MHFRPFSPEIYQLALFMAFMGQMNAMNLFVHGTNKRGARKMLPRTKQEKILKNTKVLNRLRME